MPTYLKRKGRVADLSPASGNRSSRFLERAGNISEGVCEYCEGFRSPRLPSDGFGNRLRDWWAFQALEVTFSFWRHRFPDGLACIDRDGVNPMLVGQVCVFTKRNDVWIERDNQAKDTNYQCRNSNLNCEPDPMTRMMPVEPELVHPLEFKHRLPSINIGDPEFLP